MHYISFAFIYLILLQIMQAEECNKTLTIKDDQQDISNAATQMPPGDAPCAIKMTTDEPYILKINLSISPKSPDLAGGQCGTDNYVTIGNDENDQSDKICRKDQTFQFYSKANAAVVLYKLKSVPDSWGFTGKVKRVNPQLPCGNFRSEFDGALSEYQFPMGGAQVEAPTTCQYTIKNTNGTSIKVVVKELNLYNTDDCKEDYLSLSSGKMHENALQICKMTDPVPQYVTEGSELVLQIKVTNYMLNPSVKLSLESGTSESSTTPSSGHPIFPSFVEHAIIIVLYALSIVLS